MAIFIGAFCRRQFSADYTIILFGFDFRQRHRLTDSVFSASERPMFMIEIAESEPRRRFSLQHIERIAQRQDLGLERNP